LGWHSSENTWQTAADCAGCQKHVDAFEQEQVCCAFLAHLRVIQSSPPYAAPPSHRVRQLRARVGHARGRTIPSGHPPSHHLSPVVKPVCSARGMDVNITKRLQPTLRTASPPPPGGR
jgi:hypothetical protein